MTAQRLDFKGLACSAFAPSGQGTHMPMLEAEQVEHDILDLLMGSILWKAMTHHDLVIAILKAWPTFQAPPHEEPETSNG